MCSLEILVFFICFHSIPILEYVHLKKRTLVVMNWQWSNPSSPPPTPQLCDLVEVLSLSGPQIPYP